MNNQNTTEDNASLPAIVLDDEDVSAVPARKKTIRILPASGEKSSKLKVVQDEV